MTGRASLLVGLLLLVVGCHGPTTTNTAQTGWNLPPGTPSAAEARQALDQLRIAVRGGLTGYERDCGRGAGCVFGRPWIDVDGDGCDQRSQVLARDLIDPVRKKPGRCAIASGTLADPYTGDTVTEVSKIQIEHVVPAAEMWRSGASKWDLTRRVAAANDLTNLVAVQGRINQVKGDKTPEEWMPPSTAAHCGYARIYTGVKAKHGLTVTAPEKTALNRALDTCTN